VLRTRPAAKREERIVTQVDGDLIGRQRVQAELNQALAATHHGTGGIVLLAGEVGVGKTRLLEACLAGSDLLALKGQTNEIATPPYGPIAAALRAYLRVHPGGLASYGPLAPYLALLLPELGSPPNHTDPAALVEAICQAFATIARNMPAVLVLDDLQWADNATLELVPILASALTQARLLIVGTYRNDELGRGHPLRRLRNDLRRARVLREIVVAPLDQVSTTTLATRILGQPPGPILAAALYKRTEGVPLFVEELAGALALRGRLRLSEAGIELAPGADLPIPTRSATRCCCVWTDCPIRRCGCSTSPWWLAVRSTWRWWRSWRAARTVLTHCSNVCCWSRSSLDGAPSGTRLLVTRSMAISPGYAAAPSIDRWLSAFKPRAQRPWPPLSTGWRRRSPSAPARRC
jgi:hypothetical protein